MRIPILGQVKPNAKMDTDGCGNSTHLARLAHTHRDHIAYDERTTDGKKTGRGRIIQPHHRSGYDE